MIEMKVHHFSNTPFHAMFQRGASYVMWVFSVLLSYMRFYSLLGEHAETGIYELMTEETKREANRRCSIEEETNEEPLCTQFEYYHKVVEAIMPSVPQICESLPCEQGAYTICDYGANDGSFTVPIVTRAAEVLKTKYGKDKGINVFYEDICQNDFSLMFSTINDQLGATNMENVYTFASGTNFYQQCFPQNSVHLGLCTSAIHWLSSRPCELKNSIFLSRFSNENSEEFQLYKQQAEKDMNLFLTHRANELKPGGYLIVTSPYEHHESNFLKYMDEEWRNLLNQGIILQDEYQATNLVKYFRTEHELIAPVLDENSTAYKLGLRVVTSLSDNSTVSDSTARQIVQGIRSFTSRTLWNGLKNGRTDTEKKFILDSLYSRLEERLSKDCKRSGTDVFKTHLAVFRKVDLHDKPEE